LKIGDKIKKMRKLRNMTQSELGEKIGGMQKHQISLYESNKTIPSVESLINLSKALYVSLDYLMNDKLVDDDIKFIPQIKDKELLQQFEMLDNLPDNDRMLIKGISKAILFQHEIKEKAAK